MFRDREDAAEKLANALQERGIADPVVLALPRGGVPLGRIVADRLGAPLSVLMVKKLGAPGNPEMAIGAVADGPEPIIYVDPQLAKISGASQAFIDAEAANKFAQINKRREQYGEAVPTIPLTNKNTIIIDDGVATGATVSAAVKLLRTTGAQSIVIAVPMAPKDAAERLRKEADELICLETPDPFYAISLHYEKFDQVDDSAVVELLGANEKQFQG